AEPATSFIPIVQDPAEPPTTALPPVPGPPRPPSSPPPTHVGVRSLPRLSPPRTQVDVGIFRWFSPIFALMAVALLPIAAVTTNLDALDGWGLGRVPNPAGGG